MRGSFTKFSSALQELDKIKTDNVKIIIDQEQRAMMGVTVEEEQHEFNERFRAEMSGAFFNEMEDEDDQN